MTTRGPSVTQLAIRAISAGPVASTLRDYGFKRRAPHFWRETDGLYHAVNFQVSQWGTRGEGAFTLNLGVSAPSLYVAFTGRAFPKNPCAEQWPIQERIGALMPSRCDHWWEVTDRTDAEVLGREVATMLKDYALPFFERFRTAEQFDSELLGDHSIPRVTDALRALIGAKRALRQGNVGEARRLLRGALDECRGEPLEYCVRSMGEQLGASLDDT